MPSYNTPKKKKRIMRKFKMTEISAVDRPAQSGAKAVLMKRNEEQDHGTVEKRFAMTEGNEGHSHLLNINESTMFSLGGETSYTDGHDHPYVIDDSGNITVGMADGHTHDVTVSVSQIIKNGDTELGIIDKMFKGSVSNKNAARNGSSSKRKEKIMPENKDAVTKAEKELDAVKKQLATASILATLNDVNKAYYNQLDDSDKESFLAKTEDQREADVQLAKSSNPVIYKADDGTEFTKSDDPRFVTMAKQADKNAQDLAKSRKENADMLIAKRVEKELNNLPGNVIAKSALLNAIDNISDAAVRKDVNALIASCNSNVSKAFEEIGTREGVVIKASEDELELLAKKYAEDNDVNISKAYDAVLNTQKGQDLYSQANS